VWTIQHTVRLQCDEVPGKVVDIRDMVKSCVWASGGVLGCDDFFGEPDSVLEDDSSHDVG